ncbi:hypothetical protein J6590_065847 [Homalodisca vitripennis]|nr:hypothetical protein J6590_065847 [Homalodisca vitripennis]
MVKKTYANSFQGHLNELQEQIVRAREDRVILETRVEEQGKSMAELLRTVVREELKHWEGKKCQKSQERKVLFCQHLNW